LIVAYKPMDSSTLLITFLSLTCSAFFSGMEIAFITSNKLGIEYQNRKVQLTEKQSDRSQLSARILYFFTKRPSQFIGTMLVGNNFALVFYGIAMATLLEKPLIEPYITSSKVGILLIQTLISTLIILITAEFIPKTIFRINPNRILSVFSIPLFIIYIILWLPMIIVIGISQGLLNLFMKGQFKHEKVTFGRIDLENYIKESILNTSSKEQGKIDHEVQIFKNALDFSKVKARDCMVPRTDIIAFDVNDSIDILRKKFIETGLSKILIYRDSIDNIIGYTHSYELFKRPETIKSILLPVSIVPETMPANDVLEQFTKQKQMITVVVDEFGGTSGILTIEDIIEEIFGEIKDEHDSEQLMEQKVDENEFIFSGRYEIDQLNNKYQLKLPTSEEYETLAGFLLQQTEKIPDTNEVILFDNIAFKILEKTDTSIDLVYLEIKEN